MSIRPLLALFLTTTLAGSALSGCANDENLGSRDSKGADTFDLDSANAFWLTTQQGKAVLLYTYKNDAEVMLEVHDGPKGATEGQYNGSRTGTADEGYKLEFSCINKTSTGCVLLGDPLSLECSMAGDEDEPQLVCGSRVFRKVTFDEITP